ncbi:MAG: hypothetical protein ACE5G9_12740 [Nitrospinales bacterium]
MKNRMYGLAVFICFAFGLGANAAWAHVTPNVKFSTTKETVARLLPKGNLFLKEVVLTKDQMKKLDAPGYWRTQKDHYTFYLSRDKNNRLQKAMISVTEVSRHGPVIVAVAFNPDGKIADAVVTDVQMEPLRWVAPLLEGNYMESFKGKDSSMELKLDPKWANRVTKMNQAYALIIAHAVKKAALLFDDTFKNNRIVPSKF